VGSVEGYRYIRLEFTCPKRKGRFFEGVGGFNLHCFQWRVCLTDMYSTCAVVREKLTISLYAEYIVGIGGLLAFQRYSQVRCRCRARTRGCLAA